MHQPGLKDEIEHVQMDFCYHRVAGSRHPDAYERVLMDAIAGDQSLFATSREVLESWRITQPILYAWERDRSKLELYENGSRGPKSADKLVERFGAKWTTDLAHICHLP
jgi:glucose-6-phosphate 1-dehydrogenase